mmetsp:Transcript_2514/g.6689  ORF Transcript_2514/g.6689 Transcript_2514/m.6689 type:complete len:281 (-) Transcript_2514:491-1333(-)
MACTAAAPASQSAAARDVDITTTSRPSTTCPAAARGFRARSTYFHPRGWPGRRHPLPAAAAAAARTARLAVRPATAAARRRRARRCKTHSTPSSPAAPSSASGSARRCPPSCPRRRCCPRRPRHFRHPWRRSAATDVPSPAQSPHLEHDTPTALRAPASPPPRAAPAAAALVRRPRCLHRRRPAPAGPAARSPSPAASAPWPSPRRAKRTPSGTTAARAHAATSTAGARAQGARRAARGLQRAPRCPARHCRATAAAPLLRRPRCGASRPPAAAPTRTAR